MGRVHPVAVGDDPRHAQDLPVLSHEKVDRRRRNMLEDRLAAPATALVEDERSEGSDAALALAGWRDWVTAHRLGAAFLAALVATHVATIIGYWLPSIGLPRLDWN